MQEVDIIFNIAILMLSVVIHEVSHGFVANILGDGTARHAGRLTLNPIKHLDPIGSILVPFLTASTGGFVFGWAKPVPYNPHNLKDQKWGEAKVAAAGPLSNLLVALVFGLTLRFGMGMLGASPEVLDMLYRIVSINILLAVFNLVPIPPLDGSKVLFSVLPYHLRHIQDFMEQYWLVFIGIFIFFLSGILSPVVAFLFHLITGV
jgi:Zn-dependent protease